MAEFTHVGYAFLPTIHLPLSVQSVNRTHGSQPNDPIDWDE